MIWQIYKHLLNASKTVWSPCKNRQISNTQADCLFLGYRSVLSRHSPHFLRFSTIILKSLKSFSFKNIQKPKNNTTYVKLSCVVFYPTNNSRQVSERKYTIIIVAVVNWCRSGVVSVNFEHTQCNIYAVMSRHFPVRGILYSKNKTSDDNYEKCLEKIKK